jgi:thiol-disulfide isomerase/thioredoxin
MRKIIVLTFILLLSSFVGCNNENSANKLKTGKWRGEIIAQENRIPFNFELKETKNNYSINLINGDENLTIDDVIIKGDSLIFSMHIFDITVKAIINKNTMTGIYIKNYADNYILPFKAIYGKNTRFDDVKSTSNFDGTWETTFYSNEGKEIPAIGIFKAQNNILKGTFLTKTGDYRFLDGYTDKDTMYLYTFDGNHIYKFRAEVKNDSLLNGQYWSGKTGYKTFVSKRNKKAELPDADKLTYLKDGYNKIIFSFPGLDGNIVSLDDDKYKNKVVLLQILGTWCPNCMDETKFLSKWYNQNKDKDVEILGLAYENKKNGRADFQYAKSRVEKMKTKYQVDYDFVIAGTSSTKSASESLPMLNKVISFPTTIFIDKKGIVRKIHTGFSGPATGIHYDKFVDEFNLFMKELIEEE